MQIYLEKEVDTGTRDGMAFEGWPVVFSVSWTYDTDTGWECESAMFLRGQLGDLALDRPDALKVLGESELSRVEWDAVEYFTANAPDYLEAA